MIEFKVINYLMFIAPMVASFACATYRSAFNSISNKDHGNSASDLDARISFKASVAWISVVI